MLNDNVPDMFTFLTDTYEQLFPAELKEREKQIEDMLYNPSQGIDTVFNKIQEYQDLCALSHNPKTDMQLVTYANLVFQKTGIFMTSLNDWNSRVVGAMFFTTFTIFVRRQYREFKAVGGLTIQNLHVEHDARD